MKIFFQYKNLQNIYSLEIFKTNLYFFINSIYSLILITKKN